LFQIYGTIEASTDQSAYQKDPRQWLKFENLENLAVEGGGYINGNGETWWKKSCKRDPNLVSHWSCILFTTFEY